jgi:flagellar motor protein MotB
MEFGGLREAPKFRTPEEELAFLREKVASHERELATQNIEKSREEITHEALTAYKKVDAQDALHEDYRMPVKETEAVALALAPEEHDSQIEELYGMLLERGIKNTLDVVSRMHNPHLEDDFHRFLVQFLHSSGSIPGLKENIPEFKSLHLALFEVTLPPLEGEGKTFKDFLTAMEQFFAGMQTISIGEQNKFKQYFTIEIAVSHDSPEIVLYVSIPKDRKSLLEKQILSFYKNARVTEVTNDYNVFHPEGATMGAVAEFTEYEVFPIKTHDEFDHDPLSAILNAFSKLDKTQEGAALQFVIMPAGDAYIKKFARVLDKVKHGEKLKAALDEFHDVKKELADFGKALFKSAKKIEGEKEQIKEIDDTAVENITEKIKSTIVLSSVRVVASSSSEVRTREIIQNIESSFSQFTRANSNSIRFRPVDDKHMGQFLHSFSFRLPDEADALPLNLKELATLVHFPVGSTGSPELKESKAGQAAAPISMGTDGIQIGINSYRGVDTPVYLKEVDRMRHFYVIGQTGTGKTGILMNMIRQDILNGDGVCYIDPHGTDIQKILSYIPKNRIDDVIYFDPASTARPMALNMLEFDPERPEQKTLVINELLGIFSQLFDMKTAGGPLFEQYFKNSAGLVMSDPASGNTILEIGRVLSDKKFRDMKLERCTNPIIKQFWKTAEATTGEQGLENFVPYITSKFDTFISNEIMRPIIAQEKSSFNFREIIDNKKILLVNLSKGRLGDINANLLGLILVGKIQMAALSRADTSGNLPPFYLYIDEFQNFTTPSISSILSEARKYKLSLNVAHQYLSQLSDDIKNAVLGNVGSMGIFRISSEDAEVLQKRLEPVFTVQDIVKLDNRNAYVSMLVDGTPAKPFSICTADLPTGNPDIVESLKELSFLKYGRPREEVEKEVMDKFMKI